jgi:hypothetical protein
MKITVNSVLTFCALCALSVMTPAGVSLAEGNMIQTAAQAEPIPWSEIGAKVAAQYQGDGLSISATEQGALLRCVFQRLEGEATAEGLWLASTAEGVTRDKFRIVARAVGRRSFIADCGLRTADLAAAGRVTTDGNVVRFIRFGVTEEYSVSMDGVQQDFVIQSPPQLLTVHSSLVTSGELRVELEVTGAGVEPAHYGARLVLENSGRNIAYSRLLVVDATGRELPARMEVVSATPSLNPHPSTFNIFVNDTDAVYPIRIDPTFSDENWISMGGIPGASNPVYAAVVDDSGNLYIGGSFTPVGDVIADLIAKWDGNSWSALGSGMNSSVLALAASGNHLYAGGISRRIPGGTDVVLGGDGDDVVIGGSNSDILDGDNGRVDALGCRS